MTRNFWLSAGERAVKTFAQSLIATLTATSLPLDVVHVGWAGALSIAGGATLLSVLTSLSSIGDDVPGKHAA